MLVQILAWLNRLANACADILLAPLARLPGWMSATIAGMATGVLMLVVFKYTSNQAAVRRARNSIKSNLLALSLFKDSVWISLRAQGRILLAAGRLLTLSIVPVLVMFLPMCLLLGQLAALYQARPLRTGEDTVVTVHLAEKPDGSIRDVKLEETAAIRTLVGPVRVPKDNRVCWSIQATEPGLHALTFEVDGDSYEKELQVGDGFAPTSLKRPPQALSDLLLYPREAPFPADSPVKEIEVVYPERASLVAGSDSWIVYWFVISLITAFVVRPVLKVNL